MGIILSLNEVQLAFGEDVVLSDVTFSVNEGSKVGLIGVNGAGKTSLLRMIDGELKATSGSISKKKNIKIGYLKQRLEVEAEEKTAYELIFSSIKDEYKTKVKGVLKSLSFSEELQNISISKLSGGQRTRLFIAALLMSDNDLIIFDEPTNHLDIPSVNELQKLVRSSPKTFLIVSHDRYFLDKTTDATVELENGKSTMYNGAYSTFVEKKKKLRADAEKHYMLQQKEIKRIEDFVANQRKWNREKNIIAAESRLKLLDKMVKLEKPESAPKAFSLEFKSAFSGEDVLDVRSLKKSYTGNMLFNVSFSLKSTQRLFIIGPNGAGKSTLIKILTSRETAYSGVFEFGYNQTIGYYDQEQQNLSETGTVIEEIYDTGADISRSETRSLLARFCFFGDDVFKPISVLSGGERARLSVCKMVMSGKSLIIMDEPTNHLDIKSREILESALEGYGGTLLCVSHDRFFINALATHILEINKSDFQDGYKYFAGGYEHYMSKRENLIDICRDDTSSRQNTSGQQYLEAKKQKSEAIRRQKRKTMLETEIPNAEQELAELKRQTESDFASDYVKLEELYTKIGELETKITEMYDEYALYIDL